MMDKKLIRYGLKRNPFTQDIPTEACRTTPQMEHFFQRVENLAKTGGFALLTGAPGTGKSVSL
ncbi:MAG: general secretion pathway protein GspA, partial [bacterium]|nr:general secretion pathway protein GspA [bacterium]